MGQYILTNQEMEAKYITIHQIFYSQIDLNPEILKKWDGHGCQRWFAWLVKSNWNTHSQGAVQSERGWYCVTARIYMLVYGSASLGLVQALGRITLYQPKCTFGLFGYLIGFCKQILLSALFFTFWIFLLILLYKIIRCLP